MVYIAMKDKFIEYLACHQCGLNPPIIIFDVKRGLCFDVDHKKQTELKQFKNCSDMLEPISVHSIAKVIGKNCDQIHFEFDMSMNILPVLDPCSAKEPQPHRKRTGPSEQEHGQEEKPEYYPLKFDDLWDIAKPKTGHLIINGILDMLSLPKKGTIMTTILLLKIWLVSRVRVGAF